MLNLNNSFFIEGNELNFQPLRENKIIMLRELIQERKQNQLNEELKQERMQCLDYLYSLTEQKNAG